MKLIIDIPKTMLDWFKNGYPNEDDMGILIDIVLNGTPLEQTQRPKGHWIMKHRNINKIEYHTGEDVLNDEIHTVKELIRYETDDPYCACCGKRAEDISQDYCGYCGARMV